jgi:DNA-binding SARP family transcriptional activator
LPSLWYEVDGGDADLSNLFHSLGVATRLVAPRIKRPMPVPGNLQDLASFSRGYFGELFARLPENAVLVLDNFHRVPEDSSFHEAVREGLSRLPVGRKVVVISRSGPPAPLRLAFPLRFLGWEDLRLSPAETRAIVRGRWGKAPDPDVVQRLRHGTDGWAAGLSLLLATGAAGKMSPHDLMRETPREVFRYFATEVFDRLDPDMKEFLMRSAVLPEMTADAARRLTGQGRAVEKLAWLQRNNLFTEVHDERRRVYRYHGLFREFLLARAEETFAPGELDLLRGEGGRILAEAGRIDDALPLFRLSGNWGMFRRWVLAAAEDLFRQGRGSTLLEWLESLPPWEREADPWSLYWMGACRFPRDLPGSRTCFGKAFDGFREPDDATGKLLSWAGLVETVLLEMNDFTLLDCRIDWLERRGGMRSSFPSVEVEARVCAAMANALVFRRPQHPEIQAWVRRALRLARDVDDHGTRLQAHVAAASYFLWTGDKGRTGLAMEELSGIVRPGMEDPPLVLAVKVLEAMAAVCTEGDPDACLRHVAEGLRISGTTGVRGWDFLLSATGACACLLQGDDPGARKFLERMSAMLSPASRHGYCMYHYLATWSHLSRGDALRAAPHAEEAVAVSLETGMYFPEALCRLALARVLHEKGNPTGANGEQSRALSLAIAGRSKILEFMCKLVKAHFLLDRGSGADALAALREAMAVGREGEYWALFWWWRPKEMTRLCATALETGIEPEYARELVRRWRLTPDPSMIEAEGWPWPVRLYTLGRFNIVLDDRPLRFERKAQGKVLMMLKALITLGGRNVPEEQLNEVLWGDVEGDLAHQSFHTTLRRLRHLLGHEKALEFADGKLTLSNRYCRVDSWAFERLHGRVERLSREIRRRENGEEIVRLSRKAVDHYGGEYLRGDSFGNFLEVTRERLRGKFLRCVLIAGRIMEEDGQLEEAVDWYRRGVGIDPLAEEVYRRLIDCCVRAGLAAEARAIFLRCEKALRHGLGVVPSSKTRSLIRSIGTA